MTIPGEIACIALIVVILITTFAVWLARVIKFAKTDFYTSNQKTYSNNYYDYFKDN